jgi:hypothetical protein
MSNSDKPPHSQAHSLRIVEGRWFTEDYVAPDWIIQGVLQRGRLYACTSLTAHGKTAVWLYNACMVANGFLIGGHRTLASDVLILQGENPDDLKGRIIAMTRGSELANLPHIMPGHLQLGPEHIMRLRTECHDMALKLGLVIVDTAASFFPFEEENNNVQNGEYARDRLRPLTQLPGNPAVVVLCHPVKAATRDNLMPRGGGAFLNELDGNFTLWSEALGQTTQMHWQDKIRGPDFAPINYRLRPVALDGYLDNFGRPPFSVVAEAITEDAALAQAASNLMTQNQVLKTMRDQPLLSMADIARHLNWLNPDYEPDKSKVQRAITALKKDKLVYQPRAGARWMITQKGKDTINQ